MTTYCGFKKAAVIASLVSFAAVAPLDGQGQCTEEQLRKLEEIEDYYDIMTPLVNLEYRHALDGAAADISTAMDGFQKAGQAAAALAIERAESEGGTSNPPEAATMFDGLISMWSILDKGRQLDAAVAMQRATEGVLPNVHAAVERCRKELDESRRGDPGGGGPDDQDVRAVEPGDSRPIGGGGGGGSTGVATVDDGTVVDVDCPDETHYVQETGQCVPD